MSDKTDRILDAAFVLFSQHGFRKVTMSDIAEAADMSRPTLYAEFANKEAVFGGLATRQLERADRELPSRLAKTRSFEAKLGVLFDIFIIEPYAGVVDTPSGLDLLGNSMVYAPEETGAIYARFEEHLLALLTEAKKRKDDLAPKDLAHIMMLATKGLKQTTQSLKELRRLTDGLIALAVAATR